MKDISDNTSNDYFRLSPIMDKSESNSEFRNTSRMKMSLRSDISK